MNTVCWKLIDGEFAKHVLTRPHWISAKGELVDQPLPDVPLVSPLTADALAVLLVPPAAEYRVAVNRLSLPAGLRALQERDRLDFERNSFWFSVEASPQQSQYDPASHGPDVFCFMTKARLRDGEPITICPGCPQATCGMIYKTSAWQALVGQKGGFRCPNCSFDPHAPPWKPSLARPRRTLANVIRLIHEGAVR